jgi:hypothetical protein
VSVEPVARTGDLLHHFVNQVVQAVSHGLDCLLEPLFSLDALDGNVQVCQGRPEALNLVVGERAGLYPSRGLVLEGVSKDFHHR